MSLNSALAAGRAAAEARMNDVCTVGTWERSAEPDPDTLEYTYHMVPVYEGVCEFLAGATEARDVDAAGQLVVVQSSELRLPIATSAAVVEGMRVQVTASDSDPALPGTTATIQAPFRSAHTTARRFAIEVVD